MDTGERLPLNNIAVVLAEPEISENIGSVARVMKNFGAKELLLVAPPRYQESHAERTACHAQDLLSAAKWHETLEDALAPFQEVVGFTGRISRLNHSPLTIEEWSKQFKLTAWQHKTALVFGPESTGLRLEQLAQCRTFVTIPANPEYSSLNLSHAVAIVLYELARGKSEQANHGSVVFEAGSADKSDQSEPLPEWERINNLYRLIDRLAKAGQFYHAGTPSHLPDQLHALFTRGKPDKRELDILMGFLASIDKLRAN